MGGVGTGRGAVMMCRFCGEQRRPTRSGGCPVCARLLLREHVHPYIRTLAERDLRPPKKRSEARLATRRLKRSRPPDMSLREWAKTQEAGPAWLARKAGS